MFPRVHFAPRASSCLNITHEKTVMLHKNTLDAAHTTLAIIDMQEGFRSVISDFAETAARIALVAHAMQLLKIPVIVTEQYPRGLGHTANEIKAVLPIDLNAIEKTAFSSCGAQSFEAELERTQALHVLICGIEAHICVNQTTHDLLERGYRVHLLMDCITARSEHNKQTGLAKMQQSGALPSSTEMALFELMRDAKHEQFKSIQKLIK
jgi:nicotinamidase-related amidase